MSFFRNLIERVPFKYRHLNLRLKTLLVVIPASFITISLFTLLLTTLGRRYLTQSSEHFISALGQQLGFSIGRSYKIDNSRSLYRLIQEYMAYDNQILGITIVRKNGEITADSNPQRVFDKENDPDIRRVLKSGKIFLKETTSENRFVYKMVVPLFLWESRKIQGALKIDYDASRTFRLLKRIQFYGWVLAVVFSMIMAFFLVFFLNTKVTRPISELMYFITQFDFYKQVNYSMFSSSKDEIGRLEDKFYQLLKNL